MKMRFISIAGGLLASMLGLQAQVFEITPFYGYRFGGTIETCSGEDTDLEDGPSYGVALDFAPYDSDEIKMELLWSRQDSSLDLEGGGGLDHLDILVDEFQIGGVYENGRGRFRETITALVGATVFSPDQGEREARLSFGIGLGLKYFLMKNLALRADLRGYGTVVESEGAFISSGGTTVAYFSGSGFWQGEVSAGLTLAF